MVEFFEHTADVGLRVRAPDLAAVLAEGGRALFGRMDVDLVVEVVHRAGLSSKVCQMRPVGVVKG